MPCRSAPKSRLVPLRPAPSERVNALRIACASLILTLEACASLLPRAQVATQESWSNFEEAKAAIDKIVPYQSRKEDLAAQGIDPYKNPGVALLSYSDVVQRFATGSAIRPEEMDRGVRECLSAGKSCAGYAILVHRTNRKRIGNFWLDSFSFKRETDVTGWSFNALILLVGDLVVYTLYGGQPLIHEQEISRNPLGPLQGWGDTAAPQVIHP
jgi:hypothetical protein